MGILVRVATSSGTTTRPQTELRHDVGGRVPRLPERQPASPPSVTRRQRAEGGGCPRIQVEARYEALHLRIRVLSWRRRRETLARMLAASAGLCVTDARHEHPCGVPRATQRPAVQDLPHYVRRQCAKALTDRRFDIHRSEKTVDLLFGGLPTAPARPAGLEAKEAIGFADAARERRGWIPCVDEGALRHDPAGLLSRAATKLDCSLGVHAVLLHEKVYLFARTCVQGRLATLVAVGLTTPPQWCPGKRA
mmetsp:Transcript_69338/g.206483  ORF Transcript_69338/g.206483 Transcript_69338/m.206483 type:complete len:250 (-) Transcript_69338:146-895(-)